MSPPQLPSLIDRTGLQRELGVTAHAAEQIMRAVPIVRPPGIRKVYARRHDVARYLDGATLHVTEPATRGGGVSAWIRTRTTNVGERRYMVLYRRGGRAFKVASANTFRTLKEARTRRDLVAGWLALGLDPKSELAALLTREPTRSLADWFEAFTESRIDVSAKTQRSYANARDRVLPVLGHLAPEQIRPTHVQDWIVVCTADGLSPATLAHYLSVLRQVLDHAEIEPNPARSRKVRLPAGTAEEPRPPSRREWELIRAQLEPGPRRTCLRLIECDGLRVGEATKLTWGDLDFAEGRIRVSKARTKGRTSGQRWLPVPAELLDELGALAPEDERQPERRVFAGLNEQILRATLRSACEAAGVAPYSPHKLRHGRISLWLAHGFDRIAVKTWAGHAKASMSEDVYGHVVAEPHLDEWRDFWIAAYRAERLERRGLVVTAGPQEGGERG